MPNINTSNGLRFIRTRGVGADKTLPLADALALLSDEALSTLDDLELVLVVVAGRVEAHVKKSALIAAVPGPLAAELASL